MVVPNVSVTCFSMESRNIFTFVLSLKRKRDAGHVFTNSNVCVSKIRLLFT